jgi:hypothetical protein
MRTEVLETRPMTAAAEPPTEPAAAPRGPRRRGRPPLMTRRQVLERIRSLAHDADGLFRVHDTDPGLYARARRQFGSWAEAVRAAGFSYGDVIETARRRSLATRRERRAPAAQP